MGVRAGFVLILLGTFIFTLKGAHCQTSAPTSPTPSQTSNGDQSSIPWVALNGQTYECLTLPMPDAPDLASPNDFSIWAEDDVNNPPKMTEEKFDNGTMWGEKLVFHPRDTPPSNRETIMFFTSEYYCKAFVGFGVDSGKIPEFLEQK